MLLIHYYLLSLVIFNYKYKTEMFPVILMTYSIFFLTTIYSFILNTPDALFFGIIVAIVSIETKKIKHILLLEIFYGFTSCVISSCDSYALLWS